MVLVPQGTMAAAVESTSVVTVLVCSCCDDLMLCGGYRLQSNSTRYILAFSSVQKIQDSRNVASRTGRVGMRKECDRCLEMFELLTAMSYYVGGHQLDVYMLYVLNFTSDEHMPRSSFTSFLQ